MVSTAQQAGAGAWESEVPGLETENREGRRAEVFGSAATPTQQVLCGPWAAATPQLWPPNIPHPSVLFKASLFCTLGLASQDLIRPSLGR